MLGCSKREAVDENVHWLFGFLSQSRKVVKGPLALGRIPHPYDEFAHPYHVIFSRTLQANRFGYFTTSSHHALLLLTLFSAVPGSTEFLCSTDSVLGCSRLVSQDSVGATAWQTAYKRRPIIY